jgi:hypothetical protein
VVAAGSVIDGKPYELIDDAVPAHADGWLARLLTKARRTGRRPSNPALPGRRPNTYIEAVLRAEITAVLDATEGCRNSQLNTSAYNLARFVADGQLDRDVAARALHLAGEQVGLEPTEVANTIRSAFVARRVAI